MSTVDLSLPALASRYANGSLTPARLVAELAFDSGEGVWIDPPDRDRLLAEARALEERGAAARSLPLYGVPFAVKDNIDVAGRPTTAACPAFARVPERDAFVVARLRAAGALFVGKTNMDQFATGLVGTRSPYGIPANPFGAHAIVGGSSSGSAAAVARGLVSFALGTDTAGSGRVPAAFTNLIGWKPSRGLLSNRGVVPACRSLDCVSVFALTAADAASVARIATAFDPDDPASRRDADELAFAATMPQSFSFGTPRAEDLDFLGDEDAALLFAAARERLQALGGREVVVSFAPLFEAARLLYDGPWIAERLAGLERFVEEHAEALLPVTREILLGGKRPTAVDAFRGLARLAELQAEARRLFARVDLLLAPTTPTIFSREEVQADPIRRNTALGRYTNFVNLLDLAAVAVPAGFRRDGLPLGVTLIGARDADPALLALAGMLHAKLGGTCGATQTPVPPARAASPTSTSQTSPMRLAVVGAHLSGLPLNHQLVELGATLVRPAQTAPLYRLFALPNTNPPKPGLVRVAEGGCAIATEVWELPRARFGAFFANVPPPLCIGTITLWDGEQVAGFLCEAHATAQARDVSAHGGWRAYIAASTRAESVTHPKMPP